jgi:2-oxoglutarate ferredoxin oxidoreductase subunit alpha
MNEKRLRKLAPLGRRRDLFLVEGAPQSPLALVAWGSVAGAAREAVRLAWQEGISVKLLVPKLLYPVAEEVYTDFFRGVASGLVVEQSHQGQLYRILRMFVDLPRGVVPLAHSGAVPILPSQIVERLHRQVQALQDRCVPEGEPAD